MPILTSIWKSIRSSVGRCAIRSSSQSISIRRIRDASSRTRYRGEVGEIDRRLPPIFPSGDRAIEEDGCRDEESQYFITCHELPVRTINEVSPEVVRQILIRKAGRKSTDDRQLILQFKEES